MKIENGTKSHSTNQQNRDSFDFQISDDGMIIEILRHKIYAHPIRTLVQEYICNARDACREAGKDDHLITITAPTSDNPIFSVRDFGCGISPDRIANVFVRYGASTKRDDDQQTGGFGIGAKSAWAYTDTFNIVTRIDGKKRSYCAHVGANNKGTLEFVSEIDTNEDNGTEIIIGVEQSDIKSFQTAIQRCVYFWKQRPSILHLQKSDFFDVQPLFDKDGVMILADLDYDHQWSRNYPIIVVDGIPYNSNYWGDVSVKNGVLAVECKTGDVVVQASRENLADNEKNKQKIPKLIEDACTKIEKFRKEEINNSNDLHEFIKNSRFWNKHSTRFEGFTKFNVTINNLGFLSIAQKDTFDDVISVTNWNLYNARLKQRINTQTKCSLDLADWDKSIFVLIDEDCSKIKTLARIKHLIQTKNVKKVVGFTKSFKELEPLAMYRLSEIVVPKQTRSKVKNSVTHNFKVFINHEFKDSSLDLESILTDSNSYVYFNLKDESFDLNVVKRYHSIVSQYLKFKVIGTGVRTTNAIEKLKNHYPNKFFSLKEVVDTIIEKVGDSYEPFVQAAKHTQYRALQENPKVRVLTSIMLIEGIETEIHSLKDKTIVSRMLEYKNLLKDFKNKSSDLYLPSDILEKYQNFDKNFNKKLKEASDLAEFVYEKIPFFKYDYYWDASHTKALVRALDALIEVEKRGG